MSAASIPDAKTLLCLTALCLPATEWAASYLRALGDALHLSSSSIDGAVTLTFDPTAAAAVSSDDKDDRDERSGDGFLFLDRAETMAAALRSTLSKQDAVHGFVTILLLTLRGSELLQAKAAAKSKQQKQAQQQAQAAAAEAASSVLRFDARTSVVLRRLALLLRLQLSAVAALEEHAIRELQLELQQVAAADENKKEKKSKSQWMRHAKIGAAAVTAGGLLFVTGGLAAPALAAGLSGLGLASAAAFATTTTVAALLGTAGVGLTAYKVSRRTEGLTHFEFQAINSNNKSEQKETTTKESEDDSAEMKGMTVYICVSGQLRQGGPPLPSTTVENKKSSKADTASTSDKTASASTTTTALTSPDFYGPWGAQPPYLFPAQILDRFYARVAPKKRVLAPALLQRFAGREEELFRKLRDIYQVDPLTLQSLQQQQQQQPSSSSESQPSASLMDPSAFAYQQLLAEGMTRLCEIMEVETTTTTPLENATKNNAAQGQHVLSEATLDLLIDAEKPWEERMNPPVPTPVTDAPVVSEDETNKLPLESDTAEQPDADQVSSAQTILLDMEKKLNELGVEEGGEEDSPALAETSTKEYEDEENAELLQAELELLGMKATKKTSSVSGVTKNFNILWNKKAPLEENVYRWRDSIAKYGDQYTVIWDPEKLLAIGHSIENLIQEGIDKGIKKLLNYTALSAVLSAVAAPLTIVSLINGLDETWTVAGASADAAGLLLADALLSDAHGNRPVVLVGFSMGGRVVAKCLTELAAIANGRSSSSKGNPKATNEDKKKKDYNEDNYRFLTESIENDDTISKEERQRRLRAATVVRDAVIIGAPVDNSADKWALRRSVVMGRLINVYSPSDWVLSLLYRYKRWSVTPLAGLQEVKLRRPKSQEDVVLGAVENFDVSDLVESNANYPEKIPEILHRVAVGDVDCEEYHSRYFLETRTAT